MPTNTLMLRGRILEKGFTQDVLAKKLGISRQALCNKINNKAEFKASEILLLCDLLSIEEKDLYFFAT